VRIRQGRKIRERGAALKRGATGRRSQKQAACSRSTGGTGSTRLNRAHSRENDSRSWALLRAPLEASSARGRTHSVQIGQRNKRPGPTPVKASKRPMAVRLHLTCRQHPQPYRNLSGSVGGGVG
jgi:hypothetical protein